MIVTTTAVVVMAEKKEFYRGEREMVQSPHEMV
jgi:hypothetical protein